MDEVLAAFLGECYENLEKLDNELVMLEKGTDPTQLHRSISNVFRMVHTIKGSCGWLGLSKLESVAHDGEDLLVALREKGLELNPEIVTALLEMFDAIREILGEISSTGQEGNKDYSVLISKLKFLHQAQIVSDIVELEKPLVKKQAARKSIKPEALIITRPVSVEAPIREARSSEAQSTSAQISEDTSNSHLVSTATLAQSNVRIDISLLDKLMNLVGELVLARNQMLQLSFSREDALLNNISQNLNMITSELQESVMKTRMQRIGTIWNKLPRLVRDLALECKKQVHIELEGKETELDRTLLEAIKDPLTHLVRNAIDHGFELPEERQALGKQATGTLLLQAHHEGSNVNIILSDDGRGLDPEKLKAKAIEKGLITAAEANQMSEQAAFELIFHAGFSTAQTITNISGRGVGMDVVRSNIESIGGTVELSSVLGQGSKFRLKIPLTLAIIPVLMINSGGERFAIPQINLVEMVSLTDEQIHQRVEQLYNVLVYRMRGTLLPLLFLNQELGIKQSQQELIDYLHKPSKNYRLNIVILQIEGGFLGLVVDEINDTEEIVVKPLSRYLKQIPVYAGATILGDGRVALILDIVGLARRAQLPFESERKHHSNEDESYAQNKLQQMLIFKLSTDGQMAIPLEFVARLEEFEASAVETSGKLQVIQYSQEILPLIDLRHLFGVAKSNTHYLQVIVCHYHGHHVGLIIESILDTIDIEQNSILQDTLRRNWVLGSLILQGDVTELLDFEDIIQKHLPHFIESAVI